MLYIQCRRLFFGVSLRASCAHWIFFVAILLGRPAVAQPLDPNQFGSVGTLNVAGGTLNINTDTLSMSGAATFGGFLHSQPNGLAIAVFNFDNFYIVLYRSRTFIHRNLHQSHGTRQFGTDGGARTDRLVAGGDFRWRILVA
jgi:hypothetical protein